MRITGATAEGVQAIAERLGVRAIEQDGKGEVKILMRPKAGSQTFRALSTGGRVKNSLCLHGQYAFMAHVFADFPEATMSTWVNTWNYVLFQSGAKDWTLNELRERENYDTCDCTPEMADAAMRSPDELRDGSHP